MKQKTIGRNPLEEYLSSKESNELATASLQEQQTLESNQQDNLLPSSSKQRITLYISSDVIDRVKNAVYWEPGLTLAAFAEDALFKALSELEAERGKPFAQRKERKLRGGRPLN
ncbi:hypothetical protein H0W26_03430 [Candidatus Dependentiae bacterium]|nr:hypothetical protein [Candidatus Dependentiae bacterium]